MNEIDESIYTALSGDEALTAIAVDGIRKGMHPQTAAMRYVTWQVVSGTPDFTLTVESNRRVRVQFKAWDKDLSWDACNQMADRIEVLVNKSLAISGWILKDVRLLDRSDSSEVYDNITYPYTYLEHLFDVQKEV